MNPAPFPSDCRARFEPLKRLGEGGFGEVWLARQIELDRNVAVKLLHAQHLTDDAEVQRFRNEARITAALSHPGIVKVLDHGMEAGRPWIAYELLEGRTLLDVLSGGPLAPATAATAVARIAEAVQHAHEKGVLHRDIKPENVFQVEGAYKVTDFGIARWADAARVRTATGVVIGSPAYLAPELIDGLPPTAASDVYALGVTLFQLLTGELPFHEPSLVQVLERHLTAPVPDASARQPAVPKSLDAVIQRAMAKRPAERHSSAAVLAAELSTLAVTLTGGGPARPTGAEEVAAVTRRASRTVVALAPASRPAAPVPAPRSRRGMAVAVATLIAVASLVFLGLRRPSHGPAPTPSPSHRSSPSGSPLIPPAPSAAPAEPGPAIRIEEVTVIPGAVRVMVHLLLSPASEVELEIRGPDGHRAGIRKQTSSRWQHQVIGGLAENTLYRLHVRFPGGRGGIQGAPFRTLTQQQLASNLAGLAVNRDPDRFDTFETINSKTAMNNVTERLIYHDEDALAAEFKKYGAKRVGDLRQISAAYRSARLYDAYWRQLRDYTDEQGRLWIASDAARAGHLDPLSMVPPGWADLPRVEEFQRYLGVLAHGPARPDVGGLLEKAMLSVPNPGDWIAASLLAHADPATARQLARRWLATSSPPVRRIFALQALATLAAPEDIGHLVARLARPTSVESQDITAFMLAHVFEPRTRHLARDGLLAALQRGEPSPDLIWAVARQADARAAPRLEALLESSSDVTRRTTLALSLGVLRAPSSSSVLRKALNDSGHSVRRAAAWGLGQLEDRGAAVNLLAYAARPDDVEGVGLWALGELGDAGRLPEVRALAESLAGLEGAELRKAMAVFALRRLGEPSDAPIFKRFDLKALVIRPCFELEAGPPELAGSEPLMMFPFVPWIRPRQHATAVPGDAFLVLTRGVLRQTSGTAKFKSACACEIPATAGYELEPSFLTPRAHRLTGRIELIPVNDACDVFGSAYLETRYNLTSRIDLDHASGYVLLNIKKLAAE